MKAGRLALPANSPSPPRAFVNVAVLWPLFPLRRDSDTRSTPTKILCLNNTELPENGYLFPRNKDLRPTTCSLQKCRRSIICNTRNLCNWQPSAGAVVPHSEHG